MSKFVGIIAGAALIATGIGAIGGFIAIGAWGMTLTTGFATTLIGVGGSMVLGGISTILSSKAQAPVAASTGAQAVKQTIRSPISPWQVIYGRCRVGGTIIYIEQTGTGGKTLHMIVAVAHHPCQKLEAVILENEYIPFPHNPATYVPAVGSTTSYGKGVYIQFADGNGNFSLSGVTWNPARDKLTNISAVYLGFVYDKTIFPNGVPSSILFDIQGKKDIYDPRINNWQYTSNAALIVADMLFEPRWGFNCATQEVPKAALIAAANICDEAVSLKAGGTEKRYTCNGFFNLQAKRGDVLQNLLSSCGGRLQYTGGQFVIQPAAYVQPSFNLDWSQMTGPVQYKANLQARELFNGVKGTYISEANKWLATDFPPYMHDQTHGYANDQYLDEDAGMRVWRDIQLPFTTSVTCAQRLAKIELMRNRQQGHGTLAASLAAFACTALDTITFTFGHFGWTNKLFEIQAFRFTQTKQQGEDGQDAVALGTEIDIQETDPSVYTWTASTEELAPVPYVQTTFNQSGQLTATREDGEPVTSSDNTLPKEST